MNKSVSGHGTDQMEELYSSVAPDEQRDGIAKVIGLFGSGGARNSAGCPLSGTRALQVAPKRKNRPEHFALAGLFSFQFCGAGEGIRILGTASPDAESTDSTEQNATANAASAMLGTLQDDSRTFHQAVVDANQHRLKRLERLAALDPAARPALAAARALDAAYHQDNVASEASLAEMAEALGGGR